MDSIGATSLLAPAQAAGSHNAFTDLQSDDFIKLLITQLTSQDPLEPTGNEELLQQISSIRNIELSTTLTDSLRNLTGQQRFAAGSALIGQYVSGQPGADGSVISGIVSAVRFDAQGQPTLQLANGSEVPLDSIAGIEPPVRAAERLIGQLVSGVDRRDPVHPKPVQGTVASVRVDPSGEVLLELDTGGDVRFQDLVTTTTV